MAGFRIVTAGHLSAMARPSIDAVAVAEGMAILFVARRRHLAAVAICVAMAAFAAFAAAFAIAVILGLCVVPGKRASGEIKGHRSGAEQ